VVARRGEVRMGEGGDNAAGRARWRNGLIRSALMPVMWEEVSHELQIRAFTPLRGDLRAFRIRTGNRRTAEPVLRGLDDASGQREHGPRLGVQSRRHCGDEIRRRATAELEQSDVSEPVRRRLLPGVAALAGPP